MGVSGSLFKIGIALLGVGLLLSATGSSIGLIMGRLGLLFVGVSILLPVIIGALLLLAASQEGSADRRSGRDRQYETRGIGARRPPHPRPARDRRAEAVAVTGHEQLDFDVESINDYQR